MKFFKDFFGGTDDSAQDYTKNQNKRNTEYITGQADKSTETALALWPQADAARNAGYQSAYDVLMAMIAPQMRAMKKGNIEAQKALLGGLTQANNAILGRPINERAFNQMRTNIPIDTSWVPQNSGIPQQPIDYRALLQNALSGTGGQV